MKPVRICSLFCSILLLSLFPSNTNALSKASSIPSENPNTYNRDFYIENFDIKASVSEDKTISVSETITVNFTQPRHGIFRRIPLKNTLYRKDSRLKDLQTSTYHNRISDLSVDQPYKTRTTTVRDSSKQEHRYLEVKIGDKNKKIEGLKTYKIDYKIQPFSSEKANREEFYFNIIGDGWDAAIKRTSFNITMPKNFDPERIGFSVGSRYTSGHNKNHLIYSVENLSISGQYTALLPPRNAITIRMELPENYFNTTYNPQNLITIASIITIFCAVLIITIYYLFARNKTPIIETVEFYPPKDLTLLDLGLIANKTITNQQTIGLLISLADQGYLKIIETKQKTLLKQPEFEFIKLKNYDGTDPHEKDFFNGFFKKAKVRKDGTTAIKSSDLKNNFYTIISDICNSVNSKVSRDRFFKTSLNTKFKTLFWILTIAFITLSLLIINPIGLNDPVIHIIFPSLTVVMISFTAAKSIQIIKNQKPVLGVISLLIAAIFLPLIMFFIIGSDILPIERNLNTIIFFCGILPVMATASLLAANSVNLYTTYGIDIVGKVRGFKNFLITAEKSQLEALVEKDPTYFYRILPYTYILGVSKKWIKNFEGITSAPANWYEGSSNSINSLYFYHSLSSSINAINSSINYSPSGGGSGSSGGGFSGGGFGGGGGGSW